MALYSSFGSNIKSVQQGTITISSSTSGTATITSVNTAKAVIHLNGAYFTGSSSPCGVGVALTNATTVTATTGASANITVKFTVVEYN
jgi:hypothetical protein